MGDTQSLHKHYFNVALNEENKAQRYLRKDSFITYSDSFVPSQRFIDNQTETFVAIIKFYVAKSKFNIMQALVIKHIKPSTAFHKWPCVKVMCRVVWANVSSLFGCVNCSLAHVLAKSRQTTFLPSPCSHHQPLGRPILILWHWHFISTTHKTALCLTSRSRDSRPPHLVKNINSFSS